MLFLLFTSVGYKRISDKTFEEKAPENNANNEVCFNFFLNMIVVFIFLGACCLKYKDFFLTFQNMNFICCFKLN